MQYVFFTIVDESGGLPLLDFFAPLAKMGDRAITWEKGADSKPSQTQSTSSWTSTLFKAALVGTAIAGVAYVGYRQGFFDGAIEVAKTAYDRGFSEGAVEAVKTAAEQPQCNLDSGAVIKIVNASGVRERLIEIAVPEIVEEAAEQNLFIQPNVEGFASMIPSVNTTAIHEEWSQFKNNVSSGMHTTTLTLITLGTLWFSSMIVRNCRGGR